MARGGSLAPPAQPGGAYARLVQHHPGGVSRRPRAARAGRNPRVPGWRGPQRRCARARRRRRQDFSHPPAGAADALVDPAGDLGPGDAVRDRPRLPACGVGGGIPRIAARTDGAGRAALGRCLLLISHPLSSAAVIAVAGAALLLLARSVRHRARTVLARLRLGLAILDQPRDYLCGVVRWQALGRLIRLGSLACFLAAFALPVTLATVVLVMGAQSGTRIIPVAPASAGLRIAMLGYGFASITGDVSLRRFEMTEARGTPVEEMERPFLRSRSE